MSMATAVATRPNVSPVEAIRQSLTRMAPEFQAALPEHVTVERFTRVAMTAIQQTPALVDADRNSLYGSIVRLAQDGLLPDGREAAIVMFGQKAQAMPMIAGILKKVRQSGEVAKLSAQVVHENDAFEVRYGFDEDVHHVPPALDKPRGKAIGAYATAVLRDGSRLLEVMSFEEIEKVRKVSRAGQNGPWKEWWGEMARKTVMRRLSKRLPMSTDLLDAFDRDETMATTIDLPANDRTVAPVGSRLDALEHHISGSADEGPDDSQRGEPLDIPAALAAIAAADTPEAVNVAYDGIFAQANDEDAERLISARNARLAELSA
jgi:recombination protein RecT